jgi:hypothetical protein
MPSDKELAAFSGGVGVITGAGSGIGEGLARYAATTLGMTVVLADIDAEAIGSLAEELTSTGARAVPVPTDVRDPDSLERLAQASFGISGDVRLLLTTLESSNSSTCGTLRLRTGIASSRSTSVECSMVSGPCCRK